MRRLSHIFEFGPFRLDPAEHLLLREREVVPLRPKAFDILLLLVENSGHLVAKDELLKRIWPDQIVEEGNLTKNISMLRQALGETAGSRDYIETVPKLGYRFVADVRSVEKPATELIVERHSRKHVVFEAPERAFNWKQSSNFNTALLPAALRWRPGVLAAATILFIVCMVGIAIGLQKIFMRRSQSAVKSKAVSSPQVKLNRLTFNGHIGAAAISPDGKYAAYVLTNAGLQSIWLRQAETDNTKQISAADPGLYHSITFAHDGNYIYYTKSATGDSIHSVYRMPVAGGVALKVIDDVFEDVALSPNDAQIAFVRKSTRDGESALIVANTDGTGERKITARRLPDQYKSPSWSPDGATVACITGNAERSGLKNNVVAIRLADGFERTITNHDWQWIKNVAWVPDSGDLLMTATDENTRGAQIWLVSYTDGNVRSVTNDFQRYSGISLTRDAKTLATTLTNSVWNIWVVPVAGLKPTRSDTNYAGVDMLAARQLNAASGGISWTPDGRLIYSSFATGNQEVWRANADGSEQEQLTTGTGAKRAPTASPDGRYIVFVSDATGSSHLWRMQTDGSNPTQLTSGDGGEHYPSFSADGKWVVFTQMKDWSVWKVPVDGGPPQELIGSYAAGAAVSPDGKLIAYYFRKKQPYAKLRIAVGEFSGGPPLKIFDIERADSQSMNIRWTEDGRALTYEAVNNGVSNIWSQPLDGSKAVQLTQFASDFVSYFDWSVDHRRLACIRGNWAHDLVLLTDFR